MIVQQPVLEAALAALLEGADPEQHLARTLYWERALQAVDPMGIDNPHPGDAEYHPEAVYFSMLEALGRLDFESAVLVFQVMFGEEMVRAEEQACLRTVVPLGPRQAL